MRRYLLFLVLIAIHLLPADCPAQSGTESQLTLVRDECNLLFSRANIHPALSFTDGDINISTPDKGIILGQRYFRENSTRMNPDEFLFVTRYILSHELAHQLQFSAYGADILKVTCEKKRLYECQADIISGILLGRIYDLSEAEAETRDFHTITNGLAYIYAHGDEEYGMALHPAPGQRRAAFRYGLGYNPGNLNRLLIEKRPALLEKKMDSLQWSLEIAKLIIHYPLANSQSITCTASKIEWEKGTGNPYAKFEEEYTNTGKKPLKVNIIYHVCGSPAYDNRLLHDTDFTRTLLSGDIQSYSAVLGPGEKHVFSGTLNWRDVSTASYMPYMLFPASEEDALYNAESVSAGQVEDDGAVQCLDSYTDADKKFRFNMSETAFGMDLEEAIRSLVSNDWRSLGAGFGEDPTGRILEYRSILRFPYSYKNSILLSGDPKLSGIFNGFIYVDFYEDRDEGYARMKFDKISRLLERYFGDRIKWDTTEDKDPYLHSIYGNLQGTRIRVDLSLRIKDGDCSLTMSLNNTPPIRSRPSPSIAGNERMTNSWLNSVLRSQKDNFESINGQPVASFKLKDIIPSYVYAPMIENRQASFLMCRNTDLAETINKCDTLEKIMAAMLDQQGSVYSIDHADIKDSVYAYRVYFNGNTRKNKPDIELSIFFPDRSNNNRHYFITLYCYSYRDRRRQPANP